MPKLAVILGSTRQNRQGEAVAHWVIQSAPTAALVDLRELNLPFYNESKLPGELGGVYSDPAGQRWHDTVVATDQFVFVTPEYNHSYPGVLKNAIDYMFDDWKGKQYIIVSYSTGPYGGVRGAMQLRGLLDYIGLDCKGELNIPLVDKGIDEKLTPRLQKLLTNFFHE